MNTDYVAELWREREGERTMLGTFAVEAGSRSFGVKIPYEGLDIVEGDRLWVDFVEAKS